MYQYHVIVNDYVNKFQKTIHKTVYKDDADQICEETAFDIVLKIVGNNKLDILRKNMHLRNRKNVLPEGYNVLKSKHCFTKFTIVKKDPNGTFLYGDLHKLYTVHVQKMQLPQIVYDNNIFEIDSEVYDKFAQCLSEIPEAAQDYELRKDLDNLPELSDDSDNN